MVLTSLLYLRENSHTDRKGCTIFLSPIFSTDVALSYSVTLLLPEGLCHSLASSPELPSHPCLPPLMHDTGLKGDRNAGSGGGGSGIALLLGAR